MDQPIVLAPSLQGGSVAVAQPAAALLLAATAVALACTAVALAALAVALAAATTVALAAATAVALAAALDTAAVSIFCCSWRQFGFVPSVLQGHRVCGRANGVGGLPWVCLPLPEVRDAVCLYCCVTARSQRPETLQIRRVYRSHVAIHFDPTVAAATDT